MFLDSVRHLTVFVAVKQVEKTSQNLKTDEQEPFGKTVSNGTEDKVAVDTNTRYQWNQWAPERFWALWYLLYFNSIELP